MIKKYKALFEILNTRQALTTGIITGIFVTCSFAFLALSVMVFNGRMNFSVNFNTEKVTNYAPSAQATIRTEPVETVAPVVSGTTANKPKAELFIMSYCPYGLQMQKAYLPVMDLLGKKADVDIKFVSYIMHGEKEITENTRQYCIEKDQSAKYIPYAKCFAETGDATACLSNANVDQTKLAACVSATDKTYKITESFNNKATWLGGNYPIYPIQKDLNNKYKVEGSPTLVINGAQVNVDRTPEAVKQAICATFTNKPVECATVLSSEGFQPGFGGDAGATQAATCN